MMKSLSAGVAPRLGGHHGISAFFTLGLVCLSPLWAEESGSAPQAAPRGEHMTIGELGAKARWRTQQIVARRAEDEYHNARLAREIAEIAVQEYIECTFPQELANVDAAIRRAESDLKRAEDQLAWARSNSYKGFPPLLTTDQLSVKKARFALEHALSKKKVLVSFTKDKTSKELTDQVDRARSNELAKKAVWEIEKLKESALEQRVAQWHVMVVGRRTIRGASSRSS
jgi:hypothetical protein